MTMYQGFYGITQLNEEDREKKIELFTYILPFICFVVDVAAKKAFNLSPQCWIFCIKMVIILYYLVVYVVDINYNEESTYFKLVVANQISLPILLCLYYWMLLQGWLS